MVIKVMLPTNDDASKPGNIACMQLVEEQCPSAVVLACSDSRCPPELVFDQGLGDLFVVRWAVIIMKPCVEILGALPVSGTDFSSMMTWDWGMHS